MFRDLCPQADRFGVPATALQGSGCRVVSDPWPQNPKLLALSLHLVVSFSIMPESWNMVFPSSSHIVRL